MTSQGDVEPSETWKYDAIGRVIGHGSGLDQFLYAYADATKRVKSRTSASGPYVEASYYPSTADGLLRQLTYSRPGAALPQYNYQYDSNHNVTSFAEAYPGSSGSPTTYAYDPYNQLTRVNGPGASTGLTTQYGYDLAGNLLSETSSGPNNGYPSFESETSYDPSNKIKSMSSAYFSSLGGSPQIGGGSGAYDAKGNLLSIGGLTYSYDSLNRLTAAATATQKARFVYDGIGRLVQVVDAAGGAVQNHSYAWCGNLRCVELVNPAKQPPFHQSRPAVPDKLYFKEGVKALPAPTGTAAYYVADQLGSVRELFSDGSATAQYEYGPFGNRTRVGGSGPDSDIGFAGYFHNGASGLDLARHRAYNSRLARWLTRDPMGYGVAFVGQEFNATGLNLYGYVGNNPTYLRDPSGFGWLGSVLSKARRVLADIMRDIDAFPNNPDEVFARDPSDIEIAPEAPEPGGVPPPPDPWTAEETAEFERNMNAIENSPAFEESRFMNWLKAFSESLDASSEFFFLLVPVDENGHLYGVPGVIGYCPGGA